MKRFLIFLIIAFMVFATTSYANDNNKSNKSKKASLNGDARVGVLYVFQKVAADGPWPIVHGGAWGTLKHNLWGKTFNFDFQGRNLIPNEEYTLIYYPDPWPGTGLICLGSDRANPAGNLNIHDHNFDIGTSLPATNDENWAPIYPSGAVGAKIWLVLSADVDCQDPQMIGWNPDSYLFENNLINFELFGN